MSASGIFLQRVRCPTSACASTWRVHAVPPPTDPADQGSRSLDTCGLTSTSDMSPATDLSPSSRSDVGASLINDRTKCTNEQIAWPWCGVTPTPQHSGPALRVHRWSRGRRTPLGAAHRCCCPHPSWAEGKHSHPYHPGLSCLWLLFS